MRDKLDKITALEQKIIDERDSLSMQEDSIMGDYRAKAQQKIAKLYRESEAAHEHEVQLIMEKTNQEKETIEKQRDEDLEYVAKLYSENANKVLKHLVEEVLEHGNR